jgi:hypothetical protein
VYSGNIWTFTIQSRAYAIQILFSLYEATKAPTRLFGASIVGLSFETFDTVAQLQRLQSLVFMRLPVDCHRLTRLFNYRCQSSLWLIQWGGLVVKKVYICVLRGLLLC